MSKYKITGGVMPAPLKVVLYGVEGIGKSSFAARFPQPVICVPGPGRGGSRPGPSGSRGVSSGDLQRVGIFYRKTS